MTKYQKNKQGDCIANKHTNLSNKLTKKIEKLLNFNPKIKQWLNKFRGNVRNDRSLNKLWIFSKVSSGMQIMISKNLNKNLDSQWKKRALVTLSSKLWCSKTGK